MASAVNDTLGKRVRRHLVVDLAEGEQSGYVFRALAGTIAFAIEIKGDDPAFLSHVVIRTGEIVLHDWCRASAHHHGPTAAWSDRWYVSVTRGSRVTGIPRAYIADILEKKVIVLPETVEGAQCVAIGEGYVAFGGCTESSDDVSVYNLETGSMLYSVTCPSPVRALCEGLVVVAVDGVYALPWDVGELSLRLLEWTDDVIVPPTDEEAPRFDLNAEMRKIVGNEPWHVRTGGGYLFVIRETCVDVYLGLDKHLRFNVPSPVDAYLIKGNTLAVMQQTGMVVAVDLSTRLCVWHSVPWVMQTGAGDARHLLHGDVCGRPLLTLLDRSLYIVPSFGHVERVQLTHGSV
jgi:hypothetical protein